MNDVYLAWCNDHPRGSDCSDVLGVFIGMADALEEMVRSATERKESLGDNHFLFVEGSRAWINYRKKEDGAILSTQWWITVEPLRGSPLRALAEQSE